MNNSNVPSVEWNRLAHIASADPMTPALCSNCQSKSIRCAWHRTSIRTLNALFDLSCSSCGMSITLETELPPNTEVFFPAERWARFAASLKADAIHLHDRIRQHVNMPAAEFTTNPLWEKAKWSATTFRWHPTSKFPPVMGIVFDNADAGRQLFSELATAINRRDEFEELRVSIIEGDVSGQKAGYSVHLCPDPDGLAARATADDFVVDQTVTPFLGRWNRMYPHADSPSLLSGFKREFERHQNFLLAPAVRKQDSQLWFEPEIGIVKTVVHFRLLSELTQDDPDAAAIIMPQLITPTL